MRIISVEAEINRAFISPNEADRNGEEANVTDGLFAIARALSDVADAIHHLGTNRAGNKGAIELLSLTLSKAIALGVAPDEP